MPIDVAGKDRRPGQDRAWKQILLRMPVDLLEHIDAVARAEHRTRTAEILARLGASVEGESVDEHGVIVRRVRALEK